ncbi:MAG TPA: SprT family zinc-dependent metalloprotease [Flavobacteriaceae bacterium]|nr:SprT family zinc-dependent metalloprotease [Flavobacteriaceae bacterium]
MESVRYGSKNINFKIIRTARKTMAIEVHPDSSVQLIAPENSGLDDIKKKVILRGKWIRKQQAYFETFLPTTPERQYVSGETHYYLGKRYLLNVEYANHDVVKLTGGKICVGLSAPNQERVKKVLAAWYYRLAKQKFELIMESAVQKFKGEKMESPSFEIKRMKKRWGSCTAKGKIILNPELIKTNTKCIEYVVIHELCHLIVPSHNKEFYKLLDEKMPDWCKWKDKLEKLLA